MLGENKQTSITPCASALAQGQTTSGVFRGCFHGTNPFVDDNLNKNPDVEEKGKKVDSEDDYRIVPLAPGHEKCCPCHKCSRKVVVDEIKGDITLWLDENKDKEVSNASYSIHQKVYVEGLKPSTEPNDASFVSSPEPEDENEKQEKITQAFTVYSLRLQPDLNADNRIDIEDAKLVKDMKSLGLGWCVSPGKLYPLKLNVDVNIPGYVFLEVKDSGGKGKIKVYYAEPYRELNDETLSFADKGSVLEVSNSGFEMCELTNGAIPSSVSQVLWLEVSEPGVTGEIEVVYQGKDVAEGYECHAKIKFQSLDFRIAGDGGVRDGEIDFNDPNDKNLMFWLNDDFDVVHFFEDMYQEDDDENKCGKILGASCRNCDDDVIGAAEGKPNLNYLLDNENSKHYCFRDLEDFDRVHFRIDPQLLKVKHLLVYECRLRPIDEKPSTKKPQINLFPAVSSDSFYITGEKGRLTHQKNADLGNLQTSEANVGMLAPSLETECDDDILFSINAQLDMVEQMEQRKILTIKQQWQVLRNDQVSNEYNYFLYEGVEPGKGVLEFQVKLGDMIVGRTSLTLDLHPVAAFTDTFAIDETDDTNASAMDEFRLKLKDVVKTSASASMPGCVADDETLLVLGWNVFKQEKEAWRDTVFKRLFWQGYRGRVGTFIWPSTYGFDIPLEFKKLKNVTKWRPLKWPRKLLRVKKNWDALAKSVEGIWDGPHFDRGEHRAWLSGVKGAEFFSRELENLSHLTFITHSQGNVVVGEMMRRLEPEAKRKISYLAFQGAISAQYYTTKFQAGKTIVKQTTDKGEIDVDPYAMTARDDAESLAYWGTLLNQIRWGEGTESEIEAPDIMGNFPREDGPARPYLENVLTGLRNTANFYNRQDYALNVWLGNNATKPDNLRNIGFMDKSFGFKRGAVKMRHCFQDDMGLYHSINPSKESVLGVFYQNSPEGEFAIFPGNRSDLQGDEFSIWQKAMTQDGVSEATAFFDGGECAKWCAFSFVVQSRSLAIGQLNMDPIFKSNYNLQELFHFTEVHYDHSHEFRASISDTWHLWGLVLSEIRKTK